MRFRCVPPASLLLFGLLLINTGRAGATAFDPQPDRAAPAVFYAAYTAEAAQRFRIPGAWIDAVLRAESAGNPRAVSPAGAMGLMQVMPGTWAGLRTRYRLGADPFEPRDNILAGTAYLREMLDRYGDVGAMLAAYNAGPDRVDDHLAIGRQHDRRTRMAGFDEAAPLHDREFDSIRNSQSLQHPTSLSSASVTTGRACEGRRATLDP